VPLLILALTSSTGAQTFEGTWRGASLCQVKNSPCHDEVVVYHISRDSTGVGYEMIANKIVDGKEEYMGTIAFTYVEARGSYISVDQERDARWEYKISGKSMKGTLLYRGVLYRIIEVNKE